MEQPVTTKLQALGLVAGANAALYAKNMNSLKLERNDGFIGVMIDDLTHKGITEPYRITPSHVENRLSLRGDNAVFRLYEKASACNLLNDWQKEESIAMFKDKEEFLSAIKTLRFFPDRDTNQQLKTMGMESIDSPITLEDFIRRPGFEYANLIALQPELKKLSVRAVKTAMIDISYEAYLQRENSRLKSIQKWESISLPVDLDYPNLPLLTKLARLRLDVVKPKTLGEAMRVDGVKASDIDVLARYVSRETSN